jgi:hypothetical protein
MRCSAAALWAGDSRTIRCLTEWLSRFGADATGMDAWCGMVWAWSGQCREPISLLPAMQRRSSVSAASLVPLPFSILV